MTPERNVVIRDFYQTRKEVEASDLYKVLDMMPKGAIHHIHTTAAVPVNAYLEMTRNDIVYYNERERMFKVFPRGESQKEDGYVCCNVMRQCRKSAEEYDEFLKNEILLTEKQTKGNASRDIWKHFEHKFTKVGELGKYHKFFKILLTQTVQSCIKQNVYVVELRHISGLLLDDDRNHLGLLDELKIIQEVIDETKKTVPHFELMLVLTGLKVVGDSHIQKMLDHIQVGRRAYPGLIAGFDMVN